MITHIDVSAVLRRSVCDLYSNLVTRPTGAAVRMSIEEEISSGSERSLTIIDFGNVSLLDYSCADEVIAKLVLKYCSSSSDTEAYFLFRGITDSHLDAIESVLERHRIAIVIQTADGRASTIGALSAGELRAWEAVYARKRLSASELDEMAQSGDNELSRLLQQLHARRLLMLLDNEYVSLGELLQ
jgi:hypothetical protein